MQSSLATNMIEGDDDLLGRGSHLISLEAQSHDENVNKGSREHAPTFIALDVSGHVKIYLAARTMVSPPSELRRSTSAVGREHLRIY